MLIILLYILNIGYLLYGIIHMVKNKQLLKFERLLWLILVICMPVIGTSIYLHSTFKPHHGRW
jgi:uncharacterized membrane protein YczE